MTIGWARWRTDDDPDAGGSDDTMISNTMITEAGWNTAKNEVRDTTTAMPMFEAVREIIRLYEIDPGSRISLEKTVESDANGRRAFVSVQITYFASKADETTNQTSRE